MSHFTLETLKKDYLETHQYDSNSKGDEDFFAGKSITKCYYIQSDSIYNRACNTIHKAIKELLVNEKKDAEKISITPFSKYQKINHNIDDLMDNVLYGYDESVSKFEKRLAERKDVENPFEKIFSQADNNPLINGIILGNICESYFLVKYYEDLISKLIEEYKSKFLFGLRDLDKLQIGLNEISSIKKKDQTSLVSNIKKYVDRECPKLTYIIFRGTILTEEVERFKNLCRANYIQLIYFYDPSTLEDKKEENLRDLSNEEIPYLHLIPIKTNKSNEINTLYNPEDIDKLFEFIVIPLVSDYNPDLILFHINFNLIAGNGVPFIFDEICLIKIIQSLCLISNNRLFISPIFRYNEKSQTNIPGKVQKTNYTHQKYSCSAKYIHLIDFGSITIQTLKGDLSCPKNKESNNDYLFNPWIIETIEEIYENHMPNEFKNNFSKILKGLKFYTSARIVKNHIEVDQTGKSVLLRRNYKLKHQNFFQERIFLNINGTFEDFELNANEDDNMKIYLVPETQFLVDYLENNTDIYVINGIWLQSNQNLPEIDKILYQNFIISITNSTKKKKCIVMDHPDCKVKNASLALTNQHFIIAFGKRMDSKQHSDKIFLYNKKERTWSQLKNKEFTFEARSHASIIGIEKNNKKYLMAFGGCYVTMKNNITRKYVYENIELFEYDSESILDYQSVNSDDLLKNDYEYAYPELFPFVYYEEYSSKVYVIGGSSLFKINQNILQIPLYVLKVNFFDLGRSEAESDVLRNEFIKNELENEKNIDQDLESGVILFESFEGLHAKNINYKFIFGEITFYSYIKKFGLKTTYHGSHLSSVLFSRSSLELKKNFEPLKKNISNTNISIVQTPSQILNPIVSQLLVYFTENIDYEYEILSNFFDLIKGNRDKDNLPAICSDFRRKLFEKNIQNLNKEIGKNEVTRENYSIKIKEKKINKILDDILIRERKQIKVKKVKFKNEHLKLIDMKNLKKLIFIHGKTAANSTTIPNQISNSSSDFYIMYQNLSVIILKHLIQFHKKIIMRPILKTGGEIISLKFNSGGLFLSNDALWGYIDDSVLDICPFAERTAKTMLVSCKIKPQELFSKWKENRDNILDLEMGFSDFSTLDDYELKSKKNVGIIGNINEILLVGGSNLSIDNQSIILSNMVTKLKIRSNICKKELYEHSLDLAAECINFVTINNNVYAFPAYNLTQIYHFDENLRPLAPIKLSNAHSNNVQIFHYKDETLLLVEYQDFDNSSNEIAGPMLYTLEIKDKILTSNLINCPRKLKSEANKIHKKIWYCTVNDEIIYKISNYSDFVKDGDSEEEFFDYEIVTINTL